MGIGIGKNWGRKIGSGCGCGSGNTIRVGLGTTVLQIRMATLHGRGLESQLVLVLLLWR